MRRTITIAYEDRYTLPSSMIEQLMQVIEGDRFLSTKVRDISYTRSGERHTIRRTFANGVLYWKGGE